MTLAHPFELGFCGFSGSGKTTLICKLLDQFKEFHVGYLKHDAHQFSMDHKGKDTHEAWQHGAQTVLISDSHHWAQIQKGQLHVDHLLSSDFVFIEGYKNGPQAKLWIGDSSPPQEIEGIIATIGTKPLNPTLPFFHRDDLFNIKNFIFNFFMNKKTPLWGLILTGGHSTRMKQDKALLKYQGENQTSRTFKLSEPYCEKLFLSCRNHQWENSDLNKFPQIHDRFLDFGPLGGILTAMTLHPHVAWLVVACDLPFLDDETLNYLTHSRNIFKMATAYDSSYNQLPEPLCAIYEPKIYSRLFEFLSKKIQCPRKILLNSPIQRLKLPQMKALENINFFEEYLQTKNILEANP